MIKVLILSLFAFVAVSLTSGSLLARNLFISHDQYLQLSETDKKAYVVSVMEFVVELESQYKKDLRVKNPSRENLRKTSQMILKLKSFFLEDAHAVGGAGWDDFASKFLSTLSRARNNSICIYAGWPSSMQNNLCRHPGATAKMSDYQKQTCKPDEVSCNPVIFGYKKESTKSLFCAPTNDSSKNSALECMRQALKDPSDPDADSKEARLNFLKRKLEANPAIINQIYKFTAQACLCDSGPVALDSSYGNRIRPHRTCYGLMNMMANVAPLCSQASFSNLNTSVFSELKSKIELDFGQDQGKFDGLYESYLTNVRKDHASDVKAVCPNDNLGALRVGNTGSGTATTGGASGGSTSGTNPETQADIVVTAPKACKATCTNATPPATTKTCTFKRGEETITAIGTPVFGTGDKANVVSIKINRASTVAPEDQDPNDPEPTTTDVECTITPDPTPAPEPAKKKIIVVAKQEKDETDSDRVKLKADVSPEDAKGANVKWYRKSTTTTTSSSTSTSSGASLGSFDSSTSTTTTTTTTTAAGTTTGGSAGTTTAGTTSSSTTGSTGGGASTSPTPPVKPVTTERDRPVETGADTIHDKETTKTELCAVATKTGWEDSDESCVTIDAKDPAEAARNNPQKTGSGLANPMMPTPGGGLNSTINGGIR